jgi:hypothetical protein
MATLITSPDEVFIEDMTLSPCETSGPRPRSREGQRLDTRGSRSDLPCFFQWAGDHGADVLAATHARSSSTDPASNNVTLPRRRSAGGCQWSAEPSGSLTPTGASP